MKKLLFSLMVVFSSTTFAQTAITQISVSLQAVGSIKNVFVSPGVTSVNLSAFGNVTGGAGGL